MGRRKAGPGFDHAPFSGAAVIIKPTGRACLCLRAWTAETHVLTDGLIEVGLRPRTTLLLFVPPRRPFWSLDSPRDASPFTETLTDSTPISHHCNIQIRIKHCSSRSQLCTQPRRQEEAPKRCATWAETSVGLGHVFRYSNSSQVSLDLGGDPSISGLHPQTRGRTPPQRPPAHTATCRSRYRPFATLHRSQAGEALQKLDMASRSCRLVQYRSI